MAMRRPYCLDGLTGTTLKPVYHMSSFLGEGAPIFEIRNFAKPNPDTDMFVSNIESGNALSSDHGLAIFCIDAWSWLCGGW
jgi:HCOMODA/2-hydroxy-3-carboxy-muconic semialdehyde decarboxylase